MIEERIIPGETPSCYSKVIDHRPDEPQQLPEDQVFIVFAGVLILLFLIGAILR